MRCCRSIINLLGSMHQPGVTHPEGTGIYFPEAMDHLTLREEAQSNLEPDTFPLNSLFLRSQCYAYLNCPSKTNMNMHFYVGILEQKKPSVFPISQIDSFLINQNSIDKLSILFFLHLESSTTSKSSVVDDRWDSGVLEALELLRCNWITPNPSFTLFHQTILPLLA